MQVRYEDDALRRLAEEPDFTPTAWNRDVIKAYRKTVQWIRAAKDERDLRNIKGLRLEKLKADREGQRSMRLNDQYRLIVRFESDGERVTVVVEIVDYHG